eukprot:TRINITY_DN10823_c0_g2_i1.p1 TRINITY_DN10823_c0_g2~~TRINITY_DN10823_c0_g2_i1.p1  ORF type:complete len:427 (+),score=62.18 TRINITY_DN10823_c0_g2_i1:79-1359(+)
MCIRDREQALDQDLVRCTVEQRKILVTVVGARNLVGSETYCALSRMGKTVRSEESSCSDPELNLSMKCGLSRPEEKFVISFYQPHIRTRDELVGTLAIKPVELCRKLPHAGWYLLDGVPSGEVCLTTDYDDASRREPRSQEQAVCCDVYGFNVKAEQRSWDLNQTYLVCRQERARTLWEPYSEEISSVPTLPTEQLHSLLFEFGPPPELRGATLCAFLVKPSQLPSGVSTAAVYDLRTPGLLNYYQELCIQADTLPERDTVVLQVEKDIPRTFADHNTLVSTVEGSKALRRILLAYSVHNPAVGYCQSLNNIAGMLMCLPGMSEAQVFAVLGALASLNQGWYNLTMSGMRRDLHVLEAVVLQVFDNVSEHVSDLGVPLGLVLSGYVMQLFVGTSQQTRYCGYSMGYASVNLKVSIRSGCSLGCCLL